ALRYAQRAEAAEALNPEPIASSSHAARPEGTVTFLLVDLEGPPAEGEEHFAEQVRRHGGWPLPAADRTRSVAFSRATDALACALACRRRSLFYRGLALDTGDVQLEEGTYRGAVLQRARRVLGVARGRQI